MVILQPRKGKRGGGVCALHKSYLDVKKSNVKSYSSFEVLEVIIKGKDGILRVSTFYRTGKMSTLGRGIFISELDDYLQSLSQKKGEKILCGDFNIHVHNKSSLDRADLYLTTETYVFSQLVNQPTQKSGGTLDLVFAQNGSKCFNMLKDSLFIHDLCFSVTSDHNFIEFHAPFVNEPIMQQNIEFTYRDYKSINSQIFCQDVTDKLDTINESYFSENADTAANLFCDSLVLVINNMLLLLMHQLNRRKLPSQIMTLPPCARKGVKQKEIIEEQAMKMIKEDIKLLFKMLKSWSTQLEMIFIRRDL